MGSQYGLLLLLKIPVLGMSYDTHGIFYIPVNFAFNLPNYVTSYMHYSGRKRVRLQKNCFQGIRTRTLQSVRTETLLSTSISSKKSILNAHCVGSSTLIEIGRNTPIIHVGGSLQLFHTSYMLYPPVWFLSLRLIPLGHASAAQFEI